MPNGEDYNLRINTDNNGLSYERIEGSNIFDEIPGKINILLAVDESPFDYYYNSLANKLSRDSRFNLVVTFSRNPKNARDADVVLNEFDFLDDTRYFDGIKEDCGNSKLIIERDRFKNFDVKGEYPKIMNYILANYLANYNVKIDKNNRIDKYKRRKLEAVVWYDK